MNYPCITRIKPTWSCCIIIWTCILWIYERVNQRCYQKFFSIVLDERYLLNKTPSFCKMPPFPCSPLLTTACLLLHISVLKKGNKYLNEYHQFWHLLFHYILTTSRQKSIIITSTFKKSKKKLREIWEFPSIIQLTNGSLQFQFRLLCPSYIHHFAFINGSNQ